MLFSAALNQYCEMLPCNAREIASACGISASALSRYRSGERTPTSSGKAMSRLTKGIAALLREYDVNPLATDQDVLITLTSDQVQKDIAISRFSHRMDVLMDIVDLRNADIADEVGVDPSYVSRVRHGQRMPQTRALFARACARVAADRCIESGLLDLLPSLEGISVNDASAVLSAEDSRRALFELLLSWLIGTQLVELETADIVQALELVSNFDYAPLRRKLLDDSYWSDRIAAGSILAHDDSRFFYGLEGAREAELGFIDELLRSGDRGTVTIFSNLTTQALLSDEAFRNRHKAGFMRFLERGGRLEVIHDIQRPFSEVLTGLEYCLPIYMTGRAKAYYLDYAPSAALRFSVYVSEGCAFSGEEVEGEFNSRRCHLVKRPAEIAHYRRKVEAVRKLARPMFELYRMDDPVQRQEYERTRAQRFEHAKGAEVAVGRFGALHAVSYQSECSVLALARDPVVRVVIRHPRMNEIVSHLDKILEEADAEQRGRVTT